MSRNNEPKFKKTFTKVNQLDIYNIKSQQSISDIIGLKPNLINKNIKENIEQRILSKFESKYTKYGFIHTINKDSIKYNFPVKEGYGLSSGLLRIKVSFIADVYLPTIGTKLRAQIKHINRAMIICHSYPIEINVIRILNESMCNNLEIGNYLFLEIKDVNLYDDKIICTGDIIDNKTIRPNVFMIYTFDNFDINNFNYVKEPFVNKLLGDMSKLNKLKNDIFEKEFNQGSGSQGLSFEIYQKIINSYEYINNNERKDSIGSCVIGIKADNNQIIRISNFVSRAYFKLLEILKTEPFEFDQNTSPKCLCLAEAPGGFVLALNHFFNGKLLIIASSIGENSLKQNLGKMIEITTNLIAKDTEDAKDTKDAKDYKQKITKYLETLKKLQKNVNNVPSFNESILGKTLTTLNIDLTNKEDYNYLDSVILTYNHKGELKEDTEDTEDTEDVEDVMKFDIITADGSIGANLDWDNEELLNLHLFMCESLCALKNQEIGGTFIIKIYGIYHDSTLQLIQIISNFYESLFIIKPLTSRLASNEKYLVFKKFKGISKEQYEKIYKLFFDDYPAFKPYEYVYSFVEFADEMQQINPEIYKTVKDINSYLENEQIGQFSVARELKNAFLKSFVQIYFFIISFAI